MNATNVQSLTESVAADPAQRAQAHAEARQRATEKALARAETAEAQRADNLARVREIIGELLGANTRLSIARDAAAPTFIYRAIDVETGEILREWPPADFAQFVAEHLDAESGGEAGVVVDEQA